MLQSSAQQIINVMTFNIRYNNPHDSLNSWPNRKDKLCSQVKFYETDILGVQEALDDQMVDLETCLVGYDYVGVGRDDGKAKGEYSAIFFKADRFKMEDNGTFWLSPTPSVPGSKGWDAALTRICTWVKLKNLRTGKQFFVFNTHFDHVGKVARAESAKLILQQMDAIAGGFPAILTGDLNSTPQEEAVKTFLDPANTYKLTDSKSISQEKHYGPDGTFNSFGPKETSNNPIDYIFVNRVFEVLKHATLSQSWQGSYSSDHFPVFARLKWK